MVNSLHYLKVWAYSNLCCSDQLARICLEYVLSVFLLQLIREHKGGKLGNMVSQCRRGASKEGE